MNKLKKIRESKVFRSIMSVLKVIGIVVILAFILVVCLQRFSNNKISFFNYRMFTVVSGSMKPKYDIGDVLVSKVVEPSSIKIGDDISYLGVSGGFRDKVITHRVVGIEKNSNGKYFFRTRGLTNLVEDPIISEEQLYGLVIYRSILLSLVYRIVATNIGFYLFVIIPLLFVIGSEVLTILLKREEEKRARIR